MHNRLPIHTVSEAKNPDYHLAGAEEEQGEYPLLVN